MEFIIDVCCVFITKILSWRWELKIKFVICNIVCGVRALEHWKYETLKDEFAYLKESYFYICNLSNKTQNVL